MIPAFMKYVKNIAANINSGGQYCVTTEDITIEGFRQKFSMKKVFSSIIRKEDFNTSHQQDASEGLMSFLQAMNDHQITAFNFCNYTYAYRYKCTRERCQRQKFLPGSEGIVLNVYIPETNNVSSHFDFQEAMRNHFDYQQCQ